MALCLLGTALFLSSWLAIQSWRSQPMPGCGDGDCGAVLASKWSRFLGVPVGLFGAALYAMLALFALRPIPNHQRGPRTVAATLMLMIPAAALWFVILQWQVVRAFCAWCTTTHLVATTGTVLLALAWRQDRAGPSRALSGASAHRSHRPQRSSEVWAPAGILAFFATTLFILGQAVSPEPPRPKTRTASMAAEPVAPSAPSTETSMVSATPAASTSSVESASLPLTAPVTAVAATPVEDLRLSLHGGRFHVDPREVPVIGSPSARHRMVMISDYTCRYCREAHRLLHEVRQSFTTNELAILMLPSQHGGESLEIQQLMLAAWQINPAVWLSVADDLYEERLPLVPATIRGVLETQLGASQLAASRQSNQRWMQDLFQLARGLYTANSEKAGSRSIPQFIIGQEIVVGAPSDTAEFYQLLSQHLGLVRARLPEMLLAASEVNVGKVFAGTLQSLRIPFSNPGQAPVQVDRAVLPPGGRMSQGFRIPVPPGQTSSLEIAVPIPREDGPFEQTVSFFSNARVASNNIRVLGNSWKPLTITPPFLDFGRLDVGQTATQGVLRLDLSEPAYLDSVRSENPGFKAEIHERTPGRQYEISVSTSPDLTVGRQQAMLLVELRRPVPAGWPERLAVAARALVDRAVTAVPPRILLPPGTLTSDRHHQVLVRATDGTPDFVVTDAVLEGGPAFTLPQIQRGARDGEFIVQVTLPSGWQLPEPPAATQLLIHTTHPRYPTLEVPLTAQGQ